VAPSARGTNYPASSFGAPAKGSRVIDKLTIEDAGQVLYHDGRDARW
jgi:hypothetical protein